METPVIPLSKVAAPLSSARSLNASGSQLAFAFTVCFISIMCSGISSMLMSVYLPVIVRSVTGSAATEQMNNVGAYLNSIFIFGSMFGGFSWGLICDRIGRARAVNLSTALYGLFTLLTAFSSSWIVIGAYRFITGFGVGGVLLTTNVLIAEIWPASKKAVALGIVSAAMPFGFILAGAMNNVLTNWHHAFLTGAIPLFTACAGFVLLKESALWTSSRQAASGGMKRDALFAAEQKSNLVTGSVIFGAMLIGLWAVFSWAPTWIDSIAGHGARSGDLRGLTMIVLAISGLTGSVASGWIVNNIGLRRTMMMCFAACFLFTFIVFRLNHSVSAALFVEMAALGFFFGISQGALSVFVPALFPTGIRASATGFCFNIGRLLTATVVFFIGWLVSLLGGYGNAVFIFSFIFLIGLAVTFVSKERDTAPLTAAEL